MCSFSVLYSLFFQLLKMEKKAQNEECKEIFVIVLLVVGKDDV